MRYTKFEINHYKGIKGTVTIDMARLPTSKIYTLVGLNESGKTSILEAIDLLLDDFDADDAYRMIHISDKSNFNGTVSIKATIELDADDEDEFASYCLNELGYKVAEPVGRFDITRDIEFERSRYVTNHFVWGVAIKAKLQQKGNRKQPKDLSELDKGAWGKAVSHLQTRLPRILFYKNFLFNFPDKIYLAEPTAVNRNDAATQAVIKSSQPYRDIVQDILDSMDDGLTIEEHLLKRIRSDEAQDKSALQGCLADMSKILTENIMNSWTQVFKATADEAVVEADTDKLYGPYVSIKIKHNYKPYSVSERSLGFRWFFSFFLFTQFRKARKRDNGETLFLLDEPASNLHPRSQQNLLGVFQTLANDCKIIYSTHSNYLIDPRNLAGAYIVTNSAIYDAEAEMSAIQYDTDIKAMPYRQFQANHPDQSYHYKPILDAIDYVPSDLELTDNIVALEGKNDFYTFKLMERVVRKGNTFKFYPSAGADKYDEIIRLLLAYNGNFLCVLDADKGGKNAKKRYREEFGPIVDGRILTLADINADWDGFTTESLFSEEDRDGVANAVFNDDGGYTKSRFNSAITELFGESLHADSLAYKFDDETVANFRTLFDAIDKHLDESGVIVPA